MSYSIKDEQGNWHQVTGDSVEVFLGATASAKGRIGQVPEPQAGDQDKFLGGDGSWKNVPNPQTMTGATASAAGAGGLTPTPGAGDEDKVLQGNGTWGKKLQIDIVVQNNQYGYINGSNQFVAFKSQADIDAAVAAAAAVGTATAADVLAGKTFSNSSAKGIAGTMTDHDAATNAVSVGTNNVNTYHRIPTGAYLKLQGAGYPEIVTPLTTYGDAAVGDVKSGKKFTSSAGLTATGTFASQEKTVTAGTSAASVTPDSGKYLSKVTYNPTPSQSKSCTPSTSAQTVSPDSGKLLSSVSVAAIPNQRSLGTAATGSGIDNTGPYVYMPCGWWPEYSGKAGSSYTYMTAAQAVNACPKQEKTVTAGTSAASVTPDSGKLLSKVTYNPTPSQEKTITASRSAQTVTPDSGKLLSKVTVNKYPDASGTFTTSTNGSAVDMGATNNYRYVNTTGVYNAGKSAGVNGVNAVNVIDQISWSGSHNSNQSISINATNGKIYIAFCNTYMTGMSGGTLLFGSYNQQDQPCLFFKATSNKLTITFYGSSSWPLRVAKVGYCAIW